MKKKIINLSLIGILLISLLSGCGKSEDKEEAKSTETGYYADPFHL